MIVAKNVSKKFHEDHYALMNINFSTEERPFVVIGEDGSGKTALLEIIAGVECDYEGEIFINGRERRELKNNDFPISYVTKEPVLFKFKTVYKNLEYVFKVTGSKINKDEVRKLIGEVAKDFNIIELLNKRVYTLNEFEKKLICLARISLKKSKIIILDEPFFKLNKFEISSLWQAILSVTNKLSSDLIVAETGQNLAYFDDCSILKLDFGTVV